MDNIVFVPGEFLSTLSLRRATRVLEVTRNAHTDFYPRSPCGERLLKAFLIFLPIRDFYPRSPCGERPTYLIFLAKLIPISIHALLAESDLGSAGAV